MLIIGSSSACTLLSFHPCCFNADHRLGSPNGKTNQYFCLQEVNPKEIQSVISQTGREGERGDNEKERERERRKEEEEDAFCSGQNESGNDAMG